jgi:cbb3-type cytochrome oxidase subunit 3
MAERVLTKNAYSIMFAILGIWSSIPYLIPSEFSLLVFNKVNFIYGTVYVLICLVAAIGTFLEKRYAYYSGIISIIMTLAYLGHAQYKAESANILQLATLLTMCIILIVYSIVFKPVAKKAVRRARLSTLELNLGTNY